jgi:hypothetical protein
MSSRTTLSRVVGLVFLVAALASGPASAANGFTEQGLKADGLRWQAMARFYNRPAASYYTPAALKADGLRWQAMARTYAKPTVLQSNSFDWGAAAIGGAGMVVVLLSAGLLFVGVRKLREEKLAV